MVADNADDEAMKAIWAKARAVSNDMVLQEAIEDLELKALKVEQERDDARAKVASQESQLSKLQEERNTLRDTVESQASQLFQVQADLQQEQSKAKSLETSSKTDSERAARLEAEADKLREEISRLTKSDNERREQIVRMETEAKLGDSEAVPLKFQVERLSQELDTVSGHSTWLEGELQAKNEQIAQLRKNHASELAQLRSTFDETKEEQEEATAQVTRLQRQLGPLETQNQRLARELQQTKEEAASAKGDADAALQQAERLAQLQQEQLQRLQEKHDSLANQMEAMKKHALEAQDESQRELQERQLVLQNKSKEILQEQAQAYETQLEDLRKQLADVDRRRQGAEDGLLAINAPRRTLAIADGTPTEGLSLTEVYSRLASTQDALQDETLRRKKAEIVVERIQAEIEATAPMYLRQREEYEKAMEQEEDYRKRILELVDDKKVAQNELQQVQVEFGRIQSENKNLKEESKELAKQVQSLLVSRSSGGGTPDADIVRMQTTNQRLMADIRQKATKIQELQDQLQTDTMRSKIETYERDLENLRTERENQEAIVKTIVNQRDLYRALLAQKDSQLLSSPSEETSALQLVEQHSTRASALEKAKKALEQNLAKAEASLAAVDKDKEVAAERLARYETLNAELTTSVDKLQNAVSSAKADVARSAAEASFHREKSLRLEEDLSRSRDEVSRITVAKNEMQRINAGLQDSVSKANADVSRLEADLQQIQRKLRLAETQTEAARSAERRMADESNQLRNEISRQGALIESIQRIEASLSAKTAAEEESFQAQVKSLSEKLAAAETKHATQVERLNGTIADQDAKLKESEQARVVATKDSLDAKKELLATTTKLAATTKKAAQLESQLNAAKKKLGESGDVQDAESELRLQVATLTEELEASRKQVTTLQERVATFEKLAKSNESAVAEQTEAADTAKKVFEEEIKALKNELELTSTESAKSKEVIAELTNDLASQRSERTQALEEVNARVAELEVEAEKYRKDAESTQSRYTELESEVLVLRADVAGAQNNYERELALHANARSELRTAREEADAEIGLRKTADEKAEAAAAELSEQKALFEKEKESLETTIKEHEKALEETRAQNTLLHSQLEKIGDQIEQIQGGKGMADATAEGDAPTDLGALQKTVTELREVVKYVRAEKEMIQTQLDTARRTAERERASAAIANRSLDDARAELKILQETAQGSIAGAASDIESLREKLNAAEQQAKLLSESNSHLREEVGKLESNLTGTRKELDTAKAAAGPSEQIQKKLETEKAGLLAEKESLLREINDWKGRVTSLVSKFNQVDPAEHAKLLKKAETLEGQVKELEAKKKEAEDESKRIRTLASRASKELMQNKNLVEAHKKTIAKLNSEKEALIKAQSDGASKKEVEEANEKLRKLEDERATEKIQLTGAQQMNEKLRDRLRQFQKTIMDLKKKDAQMSKELKDAKEALEKKPTTTPVTEAPTEQTTAPKIVEAPTPAAEKPTPAVPAPEKAPAKKIEKPVMAKVPPGGFKFAPSPADAPGEKAAAEKPAETTAPQQSKKRPAESDDKPELKKPKAAEAKVVEKPAESSTAEKPAAQIAPTSPKPPAERRGSGEVKETSMKEKLLEKKRKLALLQQKKKEMLEKAASASAEQANKKQKVQEEETSEEAPDLQASQSQDSQASAATDSATVEAEAAKESTAPVATEALAPVEEEEGEVAVESKEDKKEAAAEKEEAKDTKSGLSASAALFNPFASSTTSQPSFGSISGSSAFGQQSAPSWGSGKTTGFGSSTGFGAAAAKGSVFGAKSEDSSGGTGGSAFGSGSGAAFLNMKPPGSSTTTPQFTFGSSNSITLPTPANPTPQASMFNAFSTPNPAALTAKPLFGSTQNESKEESKGEESKKEEGEDGEEQQADA